MLILLLCDWLIEGWALEDVPDDEEDEGAVCVSVWEGEGDDPATLTTMSSDIIRYRQNRIYSNSHCSTRHRMHWYVCRELEVRETTPPVSLPRDFPFLVWLLDSWVTSGATYHRSRDRSLQKAHNHSSVTMVKIIYPTKKSQYAGWRFDNLQLRYYQLVSWIKQASYSWDDLTQQKCNTGLSMKWPNIAPSQPAPSHLPKENDRSHL